MQNKVYLAVSGCKRGFSVLYTSAGLDISTQGISASLCDMRQYMRLSRTGADWYGIDFIAGFRICSIYRSTVDSAGSSGGFISVALVIPDDVACRSTRALLTALLDAYCAEYYDRTTNAPLAGKAESGAALEAILQAHAAEFSRLPVKYQPGVSAFSSLPMYAAGAADALADTIFANPYQKAYLGGAKLIIIPSAFISSPAAFGVSFNTEVRTLTPASGPSDRLTGRMSAIAQRGCAVTRFMLNGTDYTSCYSSICLSPDDRTAFTIALPNGRTTSFDGTLRQAMASRTILQSGHVYAFGFFPFDVAVSLRGLIAGVPRENMLIPAVAAGGDVMPLAINARGEGRFTVKAPFSSAALVLTSPDGAKITLNPNFLGSDSDLRAVYPVDMVPLTLRLPAIMKGKATLSLAGAEFKIDITPSPAIILLPRGCNVPLFLIAGNSRWSVDPVTGTCTVTDSFSRRTPLWIWIGAAVSVVLIALAIWFIVGSRKASDNPEPKKPVVADSVVNDSAETDDIGFTSDMNPDGTPSDNNSEEKGRKEDARESDKTKEEAKILPGAPTPPEQKNVQPENKNNKSSNDKNKKVGKKRDKQAPPADNTPEPPHDQTNDKTPVIP